MTQFDWVDFYKALAKSLLNYKNNRSDLIRIIREVYEDIEINLPTLEKDNQIVDIDPFTVYGLFNKSKLKESNRIKIITTLADKLGVDAPVPSSFNSIPVLNNQNATFYYFVDERGEQDIEHLWNLFESALEYAENPNLETRKEVSKYFDIAINFKGNGNSKITMALYWIAPDSFLNLDSRNSWYIYESGKIPAELVNTLPTIELKIASDKYFDIVEKLRSFLQNGDSEFSDFKELSFEAWKYSEQINQEQKAIASQSQRNSKGAGLADDDVDTLHYWIYSPGDSACKWDEFCEKGIMGLGWSEIGDFSQYCSKDEMKEAMKEKIDPLRPHKNAAHATWQFLHEMKPGDIVFAKKGMHSVIGRGVVLSEYIYDSTETEYPNIRRVNWTNIGNWQHPGQAVMKTLTDITAYTEYVAKLNSLIDSNEGEDDIEQEEINFPEYTPEKFLEEVYMDGENYDTLVELIRMKRNVILQGAPGVGKTFAAKRLAYSMMGCKDQERVMMVQFHQSYTYEDFIEGFRPSSTSNNFEIKKGAFANFCQKASEDPDNEYFFIIDEINRGNLSKIFGELFMLIENDKRGNALQLLYSGDKFSVPPKLYIIGMMNTADRSLAMLDYALRRRFAFFEMKPGFESEGFRDYKMAFANTKFDSLIDCVEKLNTVIAADDSLGEGFCIGHSYFCNLSAISDKALSNIVEYEMVPLLKEYWYDEPIKVKDWTEKLRSSIK